MDILSNQQKCADHFWWFIEPLTAIWMQSIERNKKFVNIFAPKALTDFVEKKFTVSWTFISIQRNSSHLFLPLEMGWNVTIFFTKVTSHNAWFSHHPKKNDFIWKYRYLNSRYIICIKKMNRVRVTANGGFFLRKKVSYSGYNLALFKVTPLRNFNEICQKWHHIPTSI